MQKLVLLFMMIGVLAAGCGQVGSESAVLEGKVFVGPLTPVEQVGNPQPTVPPEVYTSRGLQIYSEDGKTLVKEISFSADGSYRVALAPGNYQLVLKPTGIDHADELPANIILKDQQTMTLDIHIDTGIR